MVSSLKLANSPAGSGFYSVSTLRFGANRTQREYLKWVLQQCAYCGDKFEGKHRATYDHIRPEAAFIKHQADQEVTNGLAACMPCNSSERKNTPLLEFLLGVKSKNGYLYEEAGNRISLIGQSVMSQADVIQKRKKAFSDYLKHMLTIPPVTPESAQQKIEGEPTGFNPQVLNGWFFKALDNILYPVWKQGERPADATVYQRCYRERLTMLFEILAEADRDFWLGDPFKDLVAQHLKEDFPRRHMILSVLKDVKDKPPIRFALKDSARVNPFEGLPAATPIQPKQYPAKKIKKKKHPRFA